MVLTCPRRSMDTITATESMDVTDVMVVTTTMDMAMANMATVTMVTTAMAIMDTEATERATMVIRTTHPSS